MNELLVLATSTTSLGGPAEIWGHIVRDFSNIGSPTALAAFLQVLPKTALGMTCDDLAAAVLPHLPDALFPGGAKAGWYTKAVQMDLEARGIIMREKTKPLRLHRM